jgi:hypothetical protein
VTESTTGPSKCPRCGEPRPLTRFDVCVPCAALCGWDPPCDACKYEDAGDEGHGLRHVATCDGNRVQADPARILEIADLSSKAMAAQRRVAAAVRDEAYERGLAQGRQDGLQRLCRTVSAFRNGVASTAPNCEAVDALEWVLQRIDEELEKL